MQASNWPVLGENRALAVPEDLTYLLTLVQARGLTPLAIRKIVSLCGTPKSFLETREDQMRQVVGDKVCAAIIALRASWERA